MGDGDKTEPQHGGLTADLKATRPKADAIAMDHVRARLEGTLFGETSNPARLGRFVLIEHLGEGGMGVVYSAYDPELDRRVALKLLRAHKGRDTDTSRSSLKREARALARLSHPNVVPVHDVVVIDGQVVLVNG